MAEVVEPVADSQDALGDSAPIQPADVPLAAVGKLTATDRAKATGRAVSVECPACERQGIAAVAHLTRPYVCAQGHALPGNPGPSGDPTAGQEFRRRTAKQRRRLTVEILAGYGFTEALPAPGHIKTAVGILAGASILERERYKRANSREGLSAWELAHDRTERSSNRSDALVSEWREQHPQPVTKANRQPAGPEHRAAAIKRYAEAILRLPNDVQSDLVGQLDVRLSEMVSKLQQARHDVAEAMKASALDNRHQPEPLTPPTRDVQPIRITKKPVVLYDSPPMKTSYSYGLPDIND